MIEDPEKRRYFPIKANHQALGAASEYSLDNVRRRNREQQERSRELARSSRLLRETVKRSSALKNPVSSGLQLQRSIGYRKELRLPVCDYYTDLFRRKTLACSNEFTIAKFLRDPNSGDIYAGVKGSGTCDIWACSPNASQRPSRYRFDDASKVPLIGLQDGEITSISMHHSGLLLAAAGNYSGRVVQVTLMRMLTIDDDNLSSRRHVQGVSRSLHIFGMEHYVPGTKVHMYRSDILALEWLNRNTVMAGLNNSLISLYDTRSAGSATRVQHPHAVTNIRAVDDWRVVVAGRNSTLAANENKLCMYDLRYAPSRLPSRVKPTKKRHHWSSAYLEFSDFANDMPGPDNLDASPGLGLLATSMNLQLRAFDSNQV
ncbi:hypothetical protein KEM54_004547 [Ascosphaera aggregata]|nr:hypothetical protein KEM54_004547 [Ascosphaera aggregata]